LIALAATIYMETMGKKGLREVAEQNAQKAAYAAKKIAEIEGFEIAFSAPKFNEFVVRGPKPAEEILRELRENEIIGGLALSKYYAGRSNEFLVCVTETNDKAQIDNLVKNLLEAVVS
jgi:Glycine cleavage system protein P (pyridoxal-binding), N-terminal domain